MRATKTLITLTGTIAVLAALTTAASAGHLSFSSQAWRATWREFTFSGGFGRTSCTLTLEGTLGSQTITKTAEANIGNITNAVTGTCQTGGITILRESLPWSVRYESFAGTLPRITRITTRISGFAFRIRESVFGIECLAAVSAEHPGLGIFNLGSTGAVTNVELGGSGIPCSASTVTISGRSTTNSSLTLTLI